MTDSTLAEQAEEWWKGLGRTVPERYSENWWDMYEEWVEYAFREIVDGHEPTEGLAESFEEIWYE